MRSDQGRWRRWRGLTACACLVLLPGCLEFSQEIWIRDDQTGRVRMEFGVAEALVTLGAQADQDPLADIRNTYAEAKATLDADPNVERCEIEEYREGGFHRLVLDVELWDVGDLDESFVDVVDHQSLFGGGPDGGVEAPGWTTQFTRLPNGNVEFVQQLTGAANPGRSAMAPPGESHDAEAEPFAAMGEAFGRAMLGSMFSDRYITVTLHAPRLVTTNGQVDEEGTTVVWQVPVADLMLEAEGFHREFRAEFEPPGALPSAALLALGAAALVLLGTIVWRARAGQPRPGRGRPPA